MLQGIGSHLVRVYRGSNQVQHNLNTILQMEDVNGTDIFGIVKKQNDLIVDMGPQAMTAGHRCELWIASDYDLDHGYFVELKRTRVLDGQRVAVEEALTDDVEGGSVVLPVAQTVGFRSGDAVVIVGAQSESSRVKCLGGSAEPYSLDYAQYTALTLYDDCALSNSYEAGDVVRASTFHRVIDLQAPDATAPYRIVTLLQIAAQGALD